MRTSAVLLISCPDRKASSPPSRTSSTGTAATSFTPTSTRTQTHVVPDARRMGSRRVRHPASPTSPGSSLRSLTGSAWSWRLARPDQRNEAGHLRLEVRPLPGRPALPAPERRTDLRHPADHLATTPTPRTGRDFYDIPFFDVPVETEQQGEAEQQQICAPRGAQSRPLGAGPLHAGAVGRLRRDASRSGSSTSTTRSCRRSVGPSPTTGRSSAASS